MDGKCVCVCVCVCVAEREGVEVLGMRTVWGSSPSHTIWKRWARKRADRNFDLTHPICSLITQETLGEGKVRECVLTFLYFFFSFFKGLSDLPSHQDPRESITCQVAHGQGKHKACLALPERENPATVLLPQREQKAVCRVALHTDDQRSTAFRWATAALLVFPYCYKAAVCWASPPGREKKKQNYVTHVHELAITLVINKVNLVSNKADTSFPKN